MVAIGSDTWPYGDVYSLVLFITVTTKALDGRLQQEHDGQSDA